MALLYPTKLETVEFGTIGWNYIYSANFEKINLYLSYLENAWNEEINKQDGDILKYDSKLKKWINIPVEKLFFEKINNIIDNNALILDNTLNKITINPNVIQFKEEKGQPNGYCPLDENGLIPLHFINFDSTRFYIDENGALNLVLGKAFTPVPLNKHGIIDYIYLPPDLRPELSGSVKLDKTDCSWFLKEKLDKTQFIEKEKDLYIDETTIIPNFRYLSINPNVIQFKEEKGQPNGYCPLDENSKIPIEYFPEDIISSPNNFEINSILINDTTSYQTSKNIEYIICDCSKFPIKIILDSEKSKMVNIKKIDKSENSIIIEDKNLSQIDIDFTQFEINIPFMSLTLLSINKQWFIF